MPSIEKAELEQTSSIETLSIIESEIDSVEFQRQVTKEMLDEIVIGGIPLSELSEKLNLPSE